MKDLTLKQAAVFEYLERFSGSNGHFPSLHEIASHFDFASTTSARDHLRALEKKGWIERDPGKARSLRLCRSKRSRRQSNGNRTDIPVLGRIAAGSPITAIEESGRFLQVPQSVFGNSEVFALEVRGESMIDEGIHDGDIAVIEKCEEVDNGQIAAVIIEDEATLKRIIREKDRLILRAANPKFPDIVLRPEDAVSVRIAGRYIGLVRSIIRPEGLVA